MQDIHAIRPPVQTGMDPFVLTLLMWGGAVLLVLLAVFIIFRWWWKKRKDSSQIDPVIEQASPYRAAMTALAELSRRINAEPRILYFEMTLILRRYVGQIHDFHAAEMTTQEFIRFLNRIGADREIKQEIIRFSNQCDPIKYAGVIPESRAVEQDISRVEKMIEALEAKRKNEMEKEAV